MTVLDMFTNGTSAASACVDGYDDRVTKSAEVLRSMIMQWYGTGLEKIVEGFGTFIEATEAGPGRPFLRGDILAMEMVRHGTDVPETGLGRTAAMLEYLKIMSAPGTWGSTPEYTAFAFMSKLNVKVYQPKSHTQLLLINETKVPNSKGTIKLLYTGRNHYDLLLSDEESFTLVKAWPKSKPVAVAFQVPSEA